MPRDLYSPGSCNRMNHHQSSPRHRNYKPPDLCNPDSCSHKNHHQSSPPGHNCRLLRRCIPDSSGTHSCRRLWLQTDRSYRHSGLCTPDNLRTHSYHRRWWRWGRSCTQNRLYILCTSQIRNCRHPGSLRGHSYMLSGLYSRSN